MKKNVYMVQPNYTYGKDVYLPYAVGAIAAYAWHFPEIQKEYCLKRLICTREKIDEAIASFEEPYMVCFSNYIWNYEYNKAFARKLKEAYPGCIVVFGGHNVPSDSAKQLETYDFIDMLMHGEGEQPFKQLLLALSRGEPLTGVNNISYRENGKIIKTDLKIFDDIDYPSPYLEGIFDDIMKDTRYSYSTTLETNRNCPYHCAYCDWGILNSNKIREIPLERIYAEIDWMAEHETDLCFCADANFGILKRDTEIVDYLIKSKTTKGYPNKIRFCYTKNSNEVVFDITKRLNECEMGKGATLSLQTLCPEALENVGRKNMKMNLFRDLISMYNGANIPTYTEIILGLPGETYESFSQGIGTLLEMGKHDSIAIFKCELLPNSRLCDEDYYEAHKIKTITTALCQDHCEITGDDITEYSTLICATDTMDTPMWIRSNIFAICFLAFHCLGLLRCFAIYCHHEKHIKYEDFYRDLVTWLFEHPDTICGRMFADIIKRIDQVFEDKNNSWAYINERYGKITWPFEEAIYLESIRQSEDFYDEIKDFLNRYGIDAEIYDDLLLYQKSIIKMPGKNNYEVTFQYDFYKYFTSVYINEYKPLEKKANQILFASKDEIPENWIDFAREIVWYRRRGGRNLHIDIVQREL